MLGALAACSSPPATAPPGRVVRIAAPASTQPLLQALVSTYQQRTPLSSVTFDVQTANSQQAQETLQNGQADLAVSSWLTSTSPPGLAVAPMAWDAVAVIIHARNPITSATLLQLRDLYRGRTLDWPALGGPVGDVTVISREGGSGLRAAFEQAVMDGQPVTLGAIVLPSDAAVIGFVQNRPDAMGYVSLLGLPAANRVDALPAQVKTLAVEGVVPDSTNLLHSGYHLSYPLILLAREPVPEVLQSFVDYVLSPAGQTVVTRFTTGVR
jgi:phosphate transport system substrate-binding protein